MGYFFYNPSENKVFVVWNVEFFDSNLIDQEANGSIEDLEIIQEEDKNPSLDTSLNHAEDDQEIDEPQSDINPILGDLDEPANYKAALMDPKSEKWLAAMNVEMQSMKDNDVWELVELPPNAKTVGHKWLFKKKIDMDGAVYTFKSRLVAKGFTQTYGVDYEETFSPVADIRAIRILIAIDVCTRPDVAFAQNITSQFQQNLGELYWTNVKNILKYLQNTKDIFLVYVGDMKRELRVSCYTVRDNLRMLMIDVLTGYVFVLNGEAVWIRKFIYGLNVVPTIKEPITMYYDNTRAIAIANDHGVTKGA
ncbi:retrotransposon protein, putative, ty1-copia subclass [Tanacetum coccineum]